MPVQVLYSSKKFQVVRDSSGRVVREFVQHPGAVAILPLVDDDHLVLLRNQRVTVGETLLEIPAGTLEPPEEPEQAARRELAEETGFHAASWRKLTEFFPSPGVLSERMHLYLARDLTPGRLNLQEDEALQPIIVPWQDALAWATDGTIRDAKTLVAILLWSRQRD
jgi:ADP-ribose pyrophosphatase